MILQVKHPNEKLESIQEIHRDITNAEMIDLRKNNLTDFKYWPKICPNLEKLHLKYNNLHDLSNFPNKLPKLKYLDLGFNNLIQISSLPEVLPNLITFNLQNNRISQITSFPRLPRLEYLHVENNHINSLKPILTNLNPGKLKIFLFFNNPIQTFKDLDYSIVTSLIPFLNKEILDSLSLSKKERQILAEISQDQTKINLWNKLEQFYKDD